MNHDAIRAVHPEAVIIHDDKGAFDADGNLIEINFELVKAKEIELQAELEAAIQAQADAKQSALNKLMALGLTEEEALALGVK